MFARVYVLLHVVSCIRVCGSERERRVGAQSEKRILSAVSAPPPPTPHWGSPSSSTLTPDHADEAHASHTLTRHKGARTPGGGASGAGRGKGGGTPRERRRGGLVSAAGMCAC